MESESSQTLHRQQGSIQDQGLTGLEQHEGE